jgi:hypothetical protein
VVVVAVLAAVVVKRKRTVQFKQNSKARGTTPGLAVCTVSVMLAIGLSNIWCHDCMDWQLAMDKRGRGRPHYSRPGGRRYIHAITKSRGHYKIIPTTKTCL